MRRFLKRIIQLRKAQNRVTIIRFLLLALSLILVILSIHYGIYSYISGRLERFYSALVIKITLFLALLYLSIKCIRSLLDDTAAAQLLDRKNKDTTDSYQNALELQNKEGEKDLIEAVLQMADNRAEDQEIKANWLPVKQLILPALILLAASALMLMIDNSGYLNSLLQFRRLRLPPEQHKEYVEVTPGDAFITKGSDLLIEVISPEDNVEHTLLWRQEKVWREEELFDLQREFRNLDYSFVYYIRTPYASSDTFQVEVFELPLVQEYLIKYQYPAYTKLDDEFDKESNGHIRALMGTDVILEIKANNPVDTSRVVFDNGKLQNMERLGKKSFRTKFRLDRSGSYHINLLDFLGNRNERIEKSITSIADRVPEIEIISPGRDTLLDQNMLLKLEFHADDDFAMHDLKLKFAVNNEAADSLLIQKDIKGSVLERDYIFDMNEIWLLPGDRVTYWLEITDNSPQQQTGSSERYIVRFPSIAEIYEEIEEEEREKSAYMEKALEESEMLQKDFEEKRRELMKKEEYDWEDKKDLEKMLEKQENLSDNIEKMAESYQDLVEKMQNNEALSSETLEKMQKIQELMEEISNDQLKQAMEEMAKAMENMDPEVMQKAMENFKFSMEDFAEKIDQTLELLEQIKKEQTLQKALEIAEEMEKMQEDLNNRSETGSESSEKLSEEQAAQEKRLNELQEQMEAANELLTPQDDKRIKEEMEQLLESGLMDSLNSDIQNASQQLSEGDMQQAQQSQQSASSKMQILRQKLDNMNSMMSMSGSAAIGEALDTAIRSLIFMSRNHINIQKRYGKDPFTILNDLIAENEGINLVLQKLYSVPMIILAVGPKFVYDVNYTMSTYRELFQYINDAKTSKVDDYLEDIQKGINLMIYDLMQSSQNMQQGGGGGMQSLMQQLQQMGEQQMMMNMMTQELFKQMSQGGRPSQEMRQEMQRLAAEEQRLAENLKRMLQENPEAQKQTAAMNQIIEDLENISQQLKRGKIDQELVDLQERILSRLLDAQKSVHKREFSKKRKAESSEILEWDTPEEIKMKFDKLRKKALLEENYEDFPTEYQELIREYLKRLNKGL